MYDIMPGKWQLTKFGSDDNLNGKIDNYEMHPVAPVSVDEMVYSSDGTGVRTNTYKGVKSLELYFTWTFVAADSLKISYAANDTITFHVLTSTAGSLGLTRTTKIENSTKVGIEWLFFSKQ